MDDELAARRSGLETLSRTECERLLGAGGVGILALVGPSAPILRPVNFAFRDDAVLLRTGEGQILAAAQASEPASFVISQVDRFEHTGWSVVVSGKLIERPEPDFASDAPVRSWSRAEKHHIVTLLADEISGRQLAAGGTAT